MDYVWLELCHCRIYSGAQCQREWHILVQWTWKAEKEESGIRNAGKMKTLLKFVLDLCEFSKVVPGLVCSISSDLIAKVEGEDSLCWITSTSQRPSLHGTLRGLLCAWWRPRPEPNMQASIPRYDNDLEDRHTLEAGRRVVNKDRIPHRPSLADAWWSSGTGSCSRRCNCDIANKDKKSVIDYGVVARQIKDRAKFNKSCTQPATPNCAQTRAHCRASRSDLI